MRGARDPISRLQRAIDCLPAATRQAMLDGIRVQPIVAGAYTDNRGGICPMLAAHRHGARTSSTLAFARAWDAFARTHRVRRASPRELQTLEHLLAASLERDAPTDLGAAIAEHRAAWYRSRELRTDPAAPVSAPAGPISAYRRSGRRGGAGEAARTAS